MLSVSSKISLGFSIVLALHVSIAALNHYGLNKAKIDLASYDAIHLQVKHFDAIDRVVCELQRNVLLFAFTGYRGPELRSRQLHSDLEDLLRRTREHEPESSLEEMNTHIATHREIFETVVIDRANRRRLVDEVMTQYVSDFDVNVRQLSGDSTETDLVRLAVAEFRAAELSALQFVHTPDSKYVRDAKSQLAQAKNLLGQLMMNDEGPREAALAAIDGYEESVIQMVQATRGYLHLVNVVLAGESTEFRRLASDMRTQKTNHVARLAKTMSEDSKRFQNSSNLFSFITIVLGVIAAWLIGRDVAPPLNAITRTFDELSRGQTCEKIPGLGRSDELGRLATAAQVFKDRAVETERLLGIAQSSESELNELNQQLAKQTALANSMAEEATAATLAKSEFLANMSHEIRTPMTAILGFAESLAENTRNVEDADAVETIKRNGEHLLAIINDILDISKIEAGKIRLEQIEYSPSQLVAEVISLSKIKSDGAGLTLEAELDGPIPARIRTDPTRLRQILINLLGNAIKFTAVGSVRLIVGYNERDRQLQFDIVDTGIGMNQTQIKGLFHPFFQADASTTRQYGGTGLGLTISKRFAEMLGGTLVLVESKEGVGSRFRATISTGPLTDVAMEGPSWPASATDHSSKSIPATRLDGLRVLLAEDGPDNQRLLSLILKKAGASLQMVENGQLALEAALSTGHSGTPFHCILMDMQMPVMDGYEATQHLRATGYEGPILALTAHAMDGDDRKCFAAGCDDYLAKPIHRALLLEKVFSWGQRSRSRQLAAPAHACPIEIATELAIHTTEGAT